MIDYADYTRRTTEPLKRIVHVRRYEQVLGLVAAPLANDRVLDYGCGDGHLFSYLIKDFPRERLVGYDPNPKLLAEASSAVSEGAALTADVEDLKRRYPFGFTLIYCVEVCEHLTDQALAELFENLRALAAPHARIVFGVPIETGLSGFAKALYRARKGQSGVSTSVAIQSLFGIKIERDMTDVQWFGHHTGFQHNRLRIQLEAAGFIVRRSICLPLPVLRSIFNNEIYFLCSVG